MWEVCARQIMLWNSHQLDEFFRVISTIVQNIVDHPEEGKYRELKCENKTIHSKLLAREGGLDILHVFGFVDKTSHGVKLLVFDSEDVSTLSENLNWLRYIYLL
jgi:hypothetical protein